MVKPLIRTAVVLRSIYVFFLMWLVLSTKAQHYNKATLDSSLHTMTDSQRVEFINNEFYTIYSSDFSLAKAYVNEAVKISRQYHWKNKEATSLMNLGIVCYLKGEYESALEAYLRSFELFDSLQNESGLALLYIEMSNYHQKTGHQEKKYAFLDSAEIWALRAEDQYALAKSYGMRAAFLANDGKYDEAKVYYLKNYKAYLELNHEVGLGYVLLDLAVYAQRDGDMKLALDYVNQSTTIRNKIGDVQGMTENMFLLGNLYMEETQYIQAIQYYKACVSKGIEIEYLDIVRKAFDGLVKGYRKQGDFRLALRYTDSSQMIKDSLFNIDRSRIIEEMQTKYEAERNARQIELQHVEIARRDAKLAQNQLIILGLVLLAIAIIILSLLLRERLKKRQLQILKKKELDYKEAQISAIINSQEEERKRFALDIHDSFGQLITVLKMNVNALDHGKTDLEKKNKLILQSQEILGSMNDELRALCFNLMPHVLIQEGLIRALKDLINRLNLSEKVHFEVLAFDFEERLSEEQEVSLYRITQEWLNNILKYNDAGMVTVQLTRGENEVTLTIEDDGQGFELENLTKSKGNGWKNIKSRVNLLKGELEIDTSPSKRGNLLILNMPLKLNAPHE